MAAKAKKAGKKSAKMSRGKKMGAVKPLTVNESITFEYGGLQHSYTPQKP
jgi:hypothetical protein